MTSLDLFQPSSHAALVPPSWGTGKMKDEKLNLWTDGRPSWQYDGKPIEQFYTLTDLGLSNVRLSDQLLPNPQHVDMSKVRIKLPFPAEHPYASHIPRTAMFPTFDSQDDPKTGVEARKISPKNAHIPANPYDIIVVSKTKGSGLRHEIQSFLPESEKKPLHWHDHDFDQMVKYPGAETQLYYPTPISTLYPNGNQRSDGNCIRGDMNVSAHTADTARNLERDQWLTTYNRNHTGLGPANPANLDNYIDKIGKDEDYDDVRPGTIRTFQPPRPVEGRIARDLTPAPPQQTSSFPEYPKDDTYIRKLTETEREEDRLLNGKEYINLPEGWQGDKQTPELTMEAGESYMPGQPMQRLSSGVCPTPELGSIEAQAIQHHDNIQQIEASNRWNLLESQQPHHNIQARQHKLDLVSVKQQPAVFYEHEAKFQRERAGLYNTTYDPYKLQGMMNSEEEKGSQVFDISEIHKGVLDLPVALNQDMADALRYNRTLGNPGSVAQLHDQPNQYETFGPFNKAKEMQKSALQPNHKIADVRTQEGELVLQESTMAEGYNTKKFLQENSLPGHVRNEPLQVLSGTNKNLGVVRMSCTPNPTSGRPFTVPDDILQGAALPGGDWLSKSLSADVLTPNTSSGGLPRYSYSAGNLEALNSHLDLPVSLERSRITSRYGINDQLVSRSTNFLPSGVGMGWSGKSAYQSQFPGGATPRKPAFDLSYKDDDDRFSWNPGFGTPRPQTSLLDIQNSFTKSDVRKKFHQQFRENGVDLRENLTSGKRHNFKGVNAQVLRGAPIVDC